MDNMTIMALADLLRQVGQAPVRLKDKVLILPFGGRILGLYPTPGQNALWVNPELAVAQSARALLGRKGWLNLGGQRIWISPEVETNIADLERFWDTYDVPKPMDPADYRVTERDDLTVTIETPMRLRFHRHDCDVSLRVGRTVALIEEPPFELPADVSFAGYTQTSVLTADSMTEGCRPGLWNIIQVPGGGEIVIPVAENARPRAMIAEPVFEQETDCIRCATETTKSFKFSLRAGDSRGFMACFKASGPTAMVVACRFSVQDESLYADAPVDDTSDTGHVQQVYVDDGSLGEFAEMEYHAPALTPGQSVTDRCQVWALAGPAEAVRDLLTVGLTA